MKTNGVGLKVEFKWIKGYAKNQHNKAVDKAAKFSANHVFHPPLSQVSVRRKFTDKIMESGSVKMMGQRLTVRIITVEFMVKAKLWRCKYEVRSKTSEFFGNVDIACAENLLRDGHCYKVRFNTDFKNPMFEKVFGEIECKK